MSSPLDDTLVHNETGLVSDTPRFLFYTRRGLKEYYLGEYDEYSGR